MLEKSTKKPRGFGFVTFKNQDAATKLLENSENLKIRGKWVDCKLAVPVEKQKKIEKSRKVNQNQLN